MSKAARPTLDSLSSRFARKDPPPAAAEPASSREASAASAGSRISAQSGLMRYMEVEAAATKARKPSSCWRSVRCARFSAVTSTKVTTTPAM